MTTPQVTTRMNQAKRKAFTLVELMIVIAIIGILVAISSPFIFGALTRAKAFTIQNDMLQIDAAVKRFEIEHGFYPPNFRLAGGVQDEADMRRYLNRIAPNNAESGAGLAKWWDQVGRKLDLDTGLVFWLSGLSTNKQYPLSGNAAIANNPSMRALAPYDANKDVDDNDIGQTINRQIFFDFETGQLVANGADAGIKSYNQPHGRGEALAYLYLNSKSYGGGNAYHTQDPADSTAPVNFFNPNTFQIIGPGMDGEITKAADSANAETNTRILSLAGPASDVEQEDNITNFSGGRLELVFE